MAHMETSLPVCSGCWRSPGQLGVPVPEFRVLHSDAGWNPRAWTPEVPEHDEPSTTRTSLARQAANVPTAISLVTLRNGYAWRTRLGSSALVEFDADASRWDWEIASVEAPGGFDQVTLYEADELEDGPIALTVFADGKARFLHRALEALCQADLNRWVAAGCPDLRSDRRGIEVVPGRWSSAALPSRHDREDLIRRWAMMPLLTRQPIPLFSITES